ncbi:MAG: class I SAM-dependent methyltransferase [Candidatus Hodarchaeota archaeon]
MKHEIDIITLNKRAWERVADTFAKRDPIEVSAIFEFFCNRLPKKSRVLDVGCGTGVPYAKLLVERDHQVTGIDISSQMILIARKNVPQATFRELSMTDLDYEEEFDGVVSSYSMLLLDPPRFNDVAQKIVHSLKNRGLLYMSLNEPCREDVDVDEDVIVEIMGETMYSRGYTKEEVMDAFGRSGMLTLLQFQRQIITSKEFGKEHMMEFVFKKK